jgi:hypothetical protein
MQRLGFPPFLLSWRPWGLFWVLWGDEVGVGEPNGSPERS